MKVKIISLDPSGTGSTGIFIVVVEERVIKSFEFEEFKSKNWTEHFDFITDLVKKHKPTIETLSNKNPQSK